MSRQHPQKDDCNNWPPWALESVKDTLKQRKASMKILVAAGNAAGAGKFKAAIKQLEDVKKLLEECQNHDDSRAAMEALAVGGGTRHRRRRRRKRRRTKRRRKSRKKSRRRKRRKSRRRRRRR